MHSGRLQHFIAYSAIGTVALMPLLVLPAMVGVLVDSASMSEAFAGWVAAVNFFGGTAIGLLMAFHMHRLDLRRAATFALALAVLMDGISAVSASPGALFLLIRFITGVATGIAYVAAMAAFARHDENERGYGLFVTLQFTVSGAGLYLLPVYADTLGASGMFLGFAALDFLALMLVAYLPGRADLSFPAAGRVSERKVLFALATVLAVLAYGLFEGANTAQFTYIERFGVASGYPDRHIGSALLVASLVGIPGAFTIVVVGHRFGRLLPMAFGIAVAIAGLLLLIATTGYAGYFLACCFLGFSWAFCLPYLQSQMASLDPAGSAIAAGTAVSTIGDAAGPGLAAVLLGDGNYLRVFAAAILLLGIAFSFFFVAEWKAPYRHAKAAA